MFLYHVTCLALRGARALACAPRLAAAAAAPTRGLAIHAGTFKTPSAVKKRFRVSAGGAILRLKGGKSHLNYHKTSRHVHRLGGAVALSGGIRARYLRALQVSALAGR
jgi:ribosomal protein L35